MVKILKYYFKAKYLILKKYWYTKEKYKNQKVLKKWIKKLENILEIIKK